MSFVDGSEVSEIGSAFTEARTPPSYDDRAYSGNQVDGACLSAFAAFQSTEAAYAAVPRTSMDGRFLTGNTAFNDAAGC